MPSSKSQAVLQYSLKAGRVVDKCTEMIAYWAGINNNVSFSKVQLLDDLFAAMLSTLQPFVTDLSSKYSADPCVAQLQVALKCLMCMKLDRTQIRKDLESLGEVKFNKIVCQLQDALCFAFYSDESVTADKVSRMVLCGSWFAEERGRYKFFQSYLTSWDVSKAGMKEGEYLMGLLYKFLKDNRCARHSHNAHTPTQ
jgi:hypothetical protein